MALQNGFPGRLQSGNRGEGTANERFAVKRVLPMSWVSEPMQNLGSWDVERRSDGAVLVRVHSRPYQGQPLPDAVFAFRSGDPQYAYWEQQLRMREGSE